MERLPNVYGLAALILQKWWYYRKQSTDSVHVHQNPNVILCRNRKINAKIHVEE
jgi:hypothetical protein